MMVVSRKTVLLILGALLLLSLAFRYPVVEHERYQTDSYFIHALADSIAKRGYASWTYHPLSYIGYYPVSYASGVPFLIAELSELTGLRVELCILMTDMVLSVLFCLAVFLMARQFILRPEFVLLATFFAVLAPRFVDTTNWDGSARGPLIVFVTLALFAAIRGSNMGQSRLIGVAVIFGALTFALHHMAVLLVLFGIGYLVATFEASYLLPKIVAKKRQIAVAVNVLFIIAVLLVTFQFFDYLMSPEDVGVDESSLFSFESPLLTVLSNMAAGYTLQIGFILPVAAVAVVSVFRHSRFSFSNIFVISAIVCFIPLLDRSIYVSMVLTPFVAILGTLWIRNLEMRSRRKLGVVVLVMVLIVSSLILPIWANNRWNSMEYISGDRVVVDNQAFNDASYLRVMYPGVYALSNNDFSSMLYSANSDTGFLGPNVFLSINGDVTGQDIAEGVTFSDAEFPNNLYVWFEYENEPNTGLWILLFFASGMASVDGSGATPAMADYFDGHSKLVVLIDQDLPKGYVNQYGSRSAKLPGELMGASWSASSQSYELDSYMAYHSGESVVYILQI